MSKNTTERSRDAGQAIADAMELLLLDLTNGYNTAMETCEGCGENRRDGSWVQNSPAERTWICRQCHDLADTLLEHEDLPSRAHPGARKPCG